MEIAGHLVVGGFSLIGGLIVGNELQSEKINKTKLYQLIPLIGMQGTFITFINVYRKIAQNKELSNIPHGINITALGKVISTNKNNDIIFKNRMIGCGLVGFGIGILLSKLIKMNYKISDKKC